MYHRIWYTTSYIYHRILLSGKQIRQTVCISMWPSSPLLLALLAPLAGALSVVSPSRSFFDLNCRLERTTAPEVGATARYIPVHNGLLCVSAAADATDDRGCEPILLSATEAAPYLDHKSCISAWLGTASEGPLSAHAPDGETPGFYLLDLSHLAKPPALGQWAPLRDSSGPGGDGSAIIGGSQVRMRDDDSVALLSIARGLGLWHRSIKFCSACGSPTESCRHGRNRQCTVCETRFRPRLDPSVIVLVTHGDRCLLGRNKRWPEGRYSTLAGFVEFGETFEVVPPLPRITLSTSAIPNALTFCLIAPAQECVLREMEEEAGVAVDRDSLRFIGSQPWLFPRSLMLGFIVEASNEELDVDQAELQDAAWFDREYVRAELAKQGTSDAPTTPGGFHVPGSISLARTVIDSWVAEA